MPVGPSHSGRSSGGGSFSGGSHGGGSFGGGGHYSFGRGYSHIPRGPRYFSFFGRTYIISGGSSVLSLLIFFIFFVGIFAFGMGVGIGDAKENITYYQEQIATIESDAEYYENLISNAKNGVEGYYTTTAYFGNSVYEYYGSNPTIPGAYYSFKDSQADWYFLVYRYSNGTNILTGNTYTQYSFSQFSGLGGEIEVAYTKDGNAWYSINTDYTLANNKDYTYSKAELENAQSSKTTFITMTVGSILVIALLVFFFIKTLKKHAKRADEQSDLESQKAKAEVDEARANATIAQEKAKQINRECKYCGGKVPDGATRCPNCNSTYFDN